MECEHPDLQHHYHDVDDESCRCINCRKRVPFDLAHPHCPACRKDQYWNPRKHESGCPIEEARRAEAQAHLAARPLPPQPPVPLRHKFVNDVLYPLIGLLIVVGGIGGVILLALLMGSNGCDPDIENCRRWP
jgi:hypothetical protein